MRGHQAIHNARLHGLMPRAISIFADGFDVPVRTRFGDPESNLSMSCEPEVWIMPDEFCKPLDLRFLLGCMVKVSGIAMDENFIALLDQIAAKAHHIVACTHDALMEFKQGKWEVLWTS